ncbi:hypothetical protein [Dactylosporangium matsuzakiense]|uniref:Uncharacterized protein n=1 Tax=Dactylosporangium matsuzakiense TaxID=53360 RepID=A0A9W6NLU3_9ACTN|nr:hypothetical protein [Dactylosporangium matsuzakiense]UWZ48220.1 hypothetical protein Dmats_18520 [Dactylosporangium matsuzakiense]GLL01453.1 hypothetical protein GCM10017581_031940 [Dactylosporangium matsuzakiense]
MKAGVDRDHGRRNLLTHEFTHVLSLGDDDGDDRDWWLSEGLAEYVADRGGDWTPARLPDVRRLIRTGGWDGTITLAAPPKDLPASDRRGRYGIALLAVTCLARHYGEDRMLAFFTAVVRNRAEPAAAALTTLGAGWPTATAFCTAEVRNRAA